MNRVLIVMLFQVIIINLVTCQISDLRMANLSDSTKSIHEMRYSLPKNSDIPPQITEESITHYNTKGYIEKVSNYRDDTLFSYCNYNYINDSVLISLEEYNSDDTKYLEIKYNYNANRTRKAIYNRSLQKTYDDKRKSIEIEYEEYYKQLFTSIITQYDHKGFIIEEKYMADDGSIRFSYKNKYDYKYNKVEIKYYNNSGSLSWRKKIKYNKHDLISQTTLFLSNRIARKSIFSFEVDNRKNWIKSTEDRQLFDNFFADELNDNTIIINRKISYY